MKLAAIGTPGIFTQFRPPDLLFNGGDAGVCEQLIGDSASDAKRFGERTAWSGGDLQDEMAFAEFGKELATEEGQSGGCEDENDHDGGDDRARPARDEGEQALVAGLEPALEGGLSDVANAAFEE